MKSLLLLLLLLLSSREVCVFVTPARFSSGHRPIATKRGVKDGVWLLNDSL